MGIFDQMKQVKQAMQMSGEMKRIQAEVEKIQATYSNGGITVTARGDFTISSIKVTDEAWKEVAAGKTDRFETMFVNCINGALKTVKNDMQEKMRKAMTDGSMNSLFGK